MDSDALDLINFSLEEKIKEMDEIYKEMNNKLKVLDGSNMIWKGIGQEAFYDHYTRVSAHFPDIIDQLNAYSLFLAESIETYNMREKYIDKDIDDNDDKLDIN
jgi:hypothetical protein